MNIGRNRPKIERRNCTDPSKTVSALAHIVQPIFLIPSDGNDDHFSICTKLTTLLWRREGLDTFGKNRKHFWGPFGKPIAYRLAVSFNLWVNLFFKDNSA